MATPWEIGSVHWNQRDSRLVGDSAVNRTSARIFAEPRLRRPRAFRRVRRRRSGLPSPCRHAQRPRRRRSPRPSRRPSRRGGDRRSDGGEGPRRVHRAHGRTARSCIATGTPRSRAVMAAVDELATAAQVTGPSDVRSRLRKGTSRPIPRTTTNPREGVVARRHGKADPEGLSPFSCHKFPAAARTAPILARHGMRDAAVRGLLRADHGAAEEGRHRRGPEVRGQVRRRR